MLTLSHKKCKSEEENITDCVSPLHACATFHALLYKRTPCAGNYLPTMSEKSSMLSDDNVRALATVVPFRHRWRHWRLLYSTARDGISLQTLYR